MSDITDIIVAYRQGETTWDELVENLTTRKYATPSRYENRPKTMAETEGYWEGVSYREDGTWDEVRRARNRGLLTSPEYLDLVRISEEKRPRPSV
jgi:hypothetical protein